MLTIQSNYIAGIVDGEGTIGLYKYDNIYIVEIKIHNTNLNLLKYVRDTIKLGHINRQSKKENHKFVYIYKLRKHEYKKFLNEILPYLKIKRRQAELVLQYLSLRKGHRDNPLTYDEIEIRENIYEQIRPLNKTGQTYLEDVEKFPKLTGNLRNLTEMNYAYLASLIDGEGSIDIGKDKYYFPITKITNTNINLIHYIQMLTYIGYVSCDKSNSNRKNCYDWHLYVHQMKDFLIKIKPYLKIKNQQCNLLLDYLELKGERRVNKLTNQEKLTLELIYDEVKELNKR
jgi:hypothetical protein